MSFRFTAHCIGSDPLNIREQLERFANEQWRPLGFGPSSFRGMLLLQFAPHAALKRKGPAMRNLVLCAVVLVGTCLIGYYADAQPGNLPFRVQAVGQAPAIPAPATFYSGGPVYETQVSSPGAIPARGPDGQNETAIAGLARSYGQTLDAAVRDNVITDETAQHLVAEVELVLSVKKARLELLRTVSTLDTIDRERQGVPGWEEAHELRKLLPKVEALRLKVDNPQGSLPRTPLDQPSEDAGR
jgi:hypothetical protein